MLLHSEYEVHVVNITCIQVVFYSEKNEILNLQQFYMLHEI